MHRRIAVLIAVVLAAAGAGTSQAGSGTMSSFDVHFAKAAAQSDLFELGSSQLALGRSDQAGSIRDFATMLRRDHQRSSRQLRALVGAKLLPKRPSPLESYLLTELAQPGDDGSAESSFGQRFAGVQVAAHRQAILLYTEEARMGSHAGLRAFARRTLPVLREHLRHANELVRSQS